jgi:flagellar motor switch protein FliN/FliY
MTQQMERETPTAEAPSGTPEAGGLAEPRRRPDASDLLGRVQVRAAVELGATELLVKDVARLGPGAVVQLDRLVGEPADLVVNGLALARGDVVVVDDHLGLRITELIGESDASRG